MQGKINHKKVSEYFKSTGNYFSGSRRISKLEKPVPSFSKTLYLNIATLYNLLISENILKFCKWKTKQPPKYNS